MIIPWYFDIYHGSKWLFNDHWWLLNDHIYLPHYIVLKNALILPWYYQGTLFQMSNSFLLLICSHITIYENHNGPLRIKKSVYSSSNLKQICTHLIHLINLLFIILSTNILMREQNLIWQDVSANAHRMPHVKAAPFHSHLMLNNTDATNQLP